MPHGKHTKGGQVVMITKHVVCCVFITYGTERRLLAVQRRANQSYPLKWNIPGGKVEGKETLAQAASRETMEELGVHAVFDPVPLTDRVFTDGDKRYELHYARDALAWAGEKLGRQ